MDQPSGQAPILAQPAADRRCWPRLAARAQRFDEWDADHTRRETRGSHLRFAPETWSYERA